VTMAHVGGFEAMYTHQFRTPGCTRAHPISTCEDISNAFQTRTKTQADGEFVTENDKPFFQHVASTHSGNTVLADVASTHSGKTVLADESSCRGSARRSGHVLCIKRKLKVVL